MPTAAVQARFATMRANLNNSLIEREEEIEAVLLGMVAQEHVLLVGDPGTAKTMLSENVTLGISGATPFDIQLNKFTTPEELCGPVSVTSLKADKYRRLTDGYLPKADVALIDEVGKASSAILNTMLKIMNEREYHNGGIKEKCPLRVMIGASNEWPIGEGFSDVGAMFDRFLIRKQMRRVSPANRRKLLFAKLPLMSACVSLADLDIATTEAVAMPWSPDAENALDEIVSLLHAQGIDPGDRRLRKSVKIAQAAAWLDGSADVQVTHLECLQHVLWDAPQEQPAKCSEIVCKIANPVGAEINAVLAEAEELLGFCTPDKLTDQKTFESIGKLKDSVKKLNGMKDASGKATRAKDYIQSRLMEIQKQMLGMAS